MACKLIKKGLIGAAIGAGALALLFGTAAPSYVRTAFHKIRHTAKDSVPIQFEIERARQQVADLTPALHEKIEEFARAEDDVKGLQKEILALRGDHEREGKQIVALRNNLANGDYRLAGSVSYTPDELKVDLRRRFDHYNQVKHILAEKQNTLAAKEKAVSAAREMLDTIQAKRRELLTQIEEIDARNKSIEASKSYNEFNFDGSALANAEKTISELNRRLNVMARTAELEGRFAEQNLPLAVEPTGDVLKDIDAEFGHTESSPAPKTADKSL